jgi:eukaryotic-like serine/threonine-protein kinase
LTDDRKRFSATRTAESVSPSSLLRGLVTPARPAPPPRARPGIPVPGEVIAGKYSVEEVLGEGGMGVVLAARHTSLGQRVAIKFLIGQAAADPTAVARFLREARAAAVLSNEHIARVHDVGTLETGEPYLVMEYLAGADLGEILRRLGTIPVPDAVGAVLQACEGLAEAHARGIIHRDLKPSNLFVSTRMDGTPLVKVLDFGISKMTEITWDGQPESLTASGLVMGSPLYMSPEQIRSSRDVDVRGDVWALGVILYELLSGVAPFAANTMGATLAKIFSETPPPVGRLRPEVPQELSAVVAQCLEKDLARRVQNVGELASRLAPFANREDVVSAERILRVSGIPAAPAAPPAASPVASTVGPGEAPRGRTPGPQPAPASASQSSGGHRGETEAPWSASQGTRLPRTGRVTVIAGGIALCVAGAAIALFVMRAPRAHGEAVPSPALPAAPLPGPAQGPVSPSATTAPRASIEAPASPATAPAPIAATAQTATAESAAHAMRGSGPAVSAGPAHAPPPSRTVTAAKPSGAPPVSHAAAPVKGNADPLGIQPE